jgi:hypothetical protein
MSSSLSSKSKTSTFSRIRAAVADLGMTTLPSCRCQRRIACAGVFPWWAATVSIVSSSSSAAWASGLQASVATSWSSPGAQLGLLQPRMQLDLVYRRQPLRLRPQPLEVLDAEVGDPERAGPPFLVDPFEGAPGLEIAVLAGHRPVDQVEVDAVEAEPLEAAVEGGQGGVVALLGVPQLGGDEDLVAGQPGGGDGGAHTGLVAVRGGGVDVAVAGLERLLDHLLRLLRRHLEDAEAQLRDLHAVMQGDVGDGRHAGHLDSVPRGPEVAGYPPAAASMRLGGSSGARVRGWRAPDQGTRTQGGRRTALFG